jgi:hypothetical protein
MTCSDVERVLPELLDDAPDGVFRTDNVALQTALDGHVKTCPDCSDLVSDLKLIASEARHLAETEEPPPRVWLQVAAQLRAEGLIQEPEPVPGRPILVPALTGRRWTSTAWWLAPVAAALLAAGAYVVSHKSTPQLARQQVPVTAVPAPAPPPQTVAETPAVAPASAPAAAPQQVARKSASGADTVPSTEESAPSPEDRQFLSAVSTRAPSMRATYENQLKAVNADIRETQAYVNQNPGESDARQHLMDTYQQKALLYQIALDRIQ